MRKLEKRDFVYLGLVQATVLAVLCNIAASDLQNNAIFELLGLWPFGAGFLFWPVAGYLLGEANRSPFCWNLGLSATLFYNFSVITGALESGSLLSRAWSHSPAAALCLTIFYLSGQALICAALARKRIAPPPHAA